MRQLSILALFVILNTTPALSQNLTLEEAVKTAQRKSPFVAAARHGLDALEHQYREAWWSWFPKINLKAVGTLIPPQEIEDPSEEDPNLSGFNVWSRTDLTAYVPIYTFGKISALKAMASKGVDIGHAAIQLAKDEVQYQVTRAWYSIQLSDELHELIDEGNKELKKAREKLEKLEAEDSEEFDQNDMFRLRIYEARVLEQVLGNKRLSRISKSGLRIAMGLNPTSPLKLPKDNALKPVTGTPKDLDSLVKIAASKRPELQILRHKVSVQESQVDRRWAEFFPDLFAAGSFTYAASTVNQQNTVFSSTVFNALGGGAALGLRLTLDYPAKSARYQKALSELAKSRSEVDARLSTLRLELESEWQEVVDRHKMMNANKRAMKAAKALLTAEVLEYENDLDGTKRFKDVLDASVSFLKSKSEWLTAVHAFNIGVAKLTRIVGQNVMSTKSTKGLK